MEQFSHLVRININNENGNGGLERENGLLMICAVPHNYGLLYLRDARCHLLPCQLPVSEGWHSPPHDKHRKCLALKSQGYYDLSKR